METSSLFRLYQVLSDHLVEDMPDAHDERVCAYCQSLDRKVFTIQEALEAMPIPGPICTDGNQQTPHGGRCRCDYSPVFPWLGSNQ